MVSRDIEREDKIEEGMWLANEGMWFNKVDIQVILSLLVEKGVFNREEVTARREYISNQPKYKQMFDTIYQQQESLQESINFGEKMKRALNKTATEEERKEVLNWLDDYIDSFKK